MSEDLQPSPSAEYAGPIGQNGWLVEEKYQQFLVNPAAVDESWRALFSNGWDRRSTMARRSETATTTPPPPATTTPVAAVALPRVTPNGLSSDGDHAGRSRANGTASNSAAPNGIAANGVTADAPARVEPTPIAAPALPAQGGVPAPSVPTSQPAPSVATPTGGEEVAAPLRGAPAILAKNMIESLGVPTATSVHPLPAVVLEANRKLINDHLSKTTGRKVSFTHLIAYAIVRGLCTIPVLNSSYVADANGTGSPGVIRHEHVGLGLAIDLERRDGGRSLVVAAVHEADVLDFSGLVDAYDDIVTRARDGKLAAPDFAGVTVAITNPGGLGTTQSVPRLMAGQGAIIGVGAIDFPVEFAATDPATLRSLGIGKVLTLTSTYDHRIIQGAESGLFLKYVHELLVGEHSFYQEVFSSIGLSAPPIRLGRDSAAPTLGSGVVDARIRALIDAYRTRGHQAASLDPLAATPPVFPVELDPVTYGFSVFDLDRSFETGGFFGERTLTVSEILDRLRATYCRTIGVEYRHVQELAERTFFESQLEQVQPDRTAEEQLRTLDLLNRAESFERFLQTRFISGRRFSLEGGESVIPFLDATLEAATRDGITEAILGMAHRGRMNALANIVGKPLPAIFAEFEENLDPLTVEGTGDVKYHKGAHGVWTGMSGRSLSATLASNPSHLEAVDPVVEGIARARQDEIGEGGEAAVLPILIHGDASMAGQGVVAETLNLSLVPGYRTGGTIHLIINNQIGFTTPPEAGRSTRYASDVAKMIDAPILHVNGDDPDAVVRCAQLAVTYRTTFHKDVVVDLICYRVRGHNEQDDPTPTQPVMYRAIAALDSTRAIYARRLTERGIVTIESAAESLAAVNAEYAAALAVTRETPQPDFELLSEKPVGTMAPLTAGDTVDRGCLDGIAAFLNRTPANFHLHPKLERQFSQRREQYDAGELDWALGEALAYGSILLEGTPIRLIGQDTRRGTFAHRNATLFDNDTGEPYTPLSSLANGEVDRLSPASPVRFDIDDSVLSEYAGLGFEFGYTIGNPKPLVIWEAQFGDFANGAQIIVDNFISASEEKWGERSGIVLLLPHGYEGQGPEHSSSRFERYLQLSSGDNLSVVQPSTAAQFFHVLRAQAHLVERRPLIIITPKSLLRERVAHSKVDELISGAFRTVLVDAPAGSADDVRRVVLCSGRLVKDLIERRDRIERAGGAPIAIVRVEQLTPWPTADVTGALARFPRAEEVIWAQDEPENMGALTYAVPRLAASVGQGAQLFTVSRRTAGSPATGAHLLHPVELDRLVDRAIGPVPS